MLKMVANLFLFRNFERCRL